MSDPTGRILPLARPASKVEPLRNLVVHFTKGSKLAIQAHSWADGNMADDEGEQTVWILFFRARQCVAQFPAAEIRCVFDSDAVDSEAVNKALRNPRPRKK